MDLIDKLKELASRIQKQREHIRTEAEVQNACVMPFFKILGYNVFDPQEVIPQFTADVGNIKENKVDYAIKKDNEVIILVECKRLGKSLNADKDLKQLFHYFATVTSSRFGILTNGILYRFFSDIEEKNVMDLQPFYELDIFDFLCDSKSLLDYHVEVLKHFTKYSFDLKTSTDYSKNLKYTRSIKNILVEGISNPSEELVKFLASQVFSGVKNKAVIAQFSVIVRNAFTQLIIEKNNESIAINELLIHEKGDNHTEEEIESYHIVKAIVSEVVKPTRVIMRGAKAHCSILLDDNKNKRICRFHFNTPDKKFISTFEQKQETKHSIDNINDIYNFADILKSTVLEYLDKGKIK